MSDLPAADAIEGIDHPRAAPRVFGHGAAQADFLQAFAAGRLHSGWLLTGPRGIGKATLAYKMAAYLLAHGHEIGGAQADILGGLLPYDAAHSKLPARVEIDFDSAHMHQIRAGSHPQLKVLTRGPNKTGSALSDVITVDQMREVKEFFHLSAPGGGYRALIIDAADEMNTSAANALLKELEEPPARVAMFLISHQPAKLLPTIRSRCRVLRMHPLGAQDLNAALDQVGFDVSDSSLATLANGSVGEAIRLSGDDGLGLYQQLLDAVSGGAMMARPKINQLADSMAGRGADGRFRLALDLLDKLLARVAQAGLFGPPQAEIVPNEADILMRLCPDPRAARIWASVAGEVSAELRHGLAVNIDPSGLFFNAMMQLEAAARRAT